MNILLKTILKTKGKDLREAYRVQDCAETTKIA